jgi:poly(A) polymerase
VVRADGVQRTFEITTLRVDVETDGRHAVVAFTGDWRADAARRDFTMNALSAEPDGLLHDYFGGVADALAGRVRFVGDPNRRLDEDKLRLLRFFRFQAHYGRQDPEEYALAACAAYAPALECLAGERVRVELLKLLAAPDPVRVWRWMQAYGVAPYVLSGRAGDAARLAGLVAVEPAPDPIRRLAALWDGEPAETAGLAERLRLSNEERDRLALLAGHRDAVTGDMDRRALRRLLYRVGRARGIDLVLLGRAAAPDDPRFAPLTAEAEAWPEPHFPLKGRDALAAGVPPGRRVGELLAAVEAWWVDGDLRADRDACLAELRRRAGGG